MFRTHPAANPVGAIVLLLGSAAFAPIALAQTGEAPALTIVVSTGSLEDALNSFARQAGITLSFDPALVSQRDAPALNGRYTVAEGLKALLAGSGLQAVSTGSGSFGIRARPTPAVTRPKDAPTQLETVIVIGNAGARYAAQTSSAGSKTDLPIKDIPQSVTVIGEDLLKDIAPRVLDEVADYVAGVEREASQSNPYAISFFFRGFNTAGNASSFNGFREGGFNTPQSGISIERIEFLKGPASVLYGGSGALAGLVNIVTKQPLAVAHNELSVGGGSFDHLYTELDSTGPLTEDKKLRYRLTAAYDKDGDFVRDTRQRSLFVSPYLSWDIGADTRLDVELLNQDIDRPGRESGFQRDPDFFRLPVRIQLGDPGVDAGAGGSLTRRLAHVEFTHRFANGWKLREGLFVHNVISDDSTVQVIGYDPATNLATRRVRAVNEYQRERYSQTELSGESTTFGFRHQWLAGAEFGRQSSGAGFNTAPYTPIDIFDPQYPGVVLAPLSEPFPASDSRSDTAAGYAQDLVTLGHGFKFLAGARYDSLESLSHTRDDGATPDTRQTDTAFSPRVGLIWQPVAASSYYASWNRSFTPNVGLSESGSEFSPERGEQIEVGVKYDLTPSLFVTAAGFQYLRKNVLTPDPANSDFSITVGEQRARGFELEAIGRVGRDWDVIASYGFLDAAITKDNDLPKGDRLTGVPRNSIGLFNKVRLRVLGVEALSATVGLAYAGKRESGLPNDPDGDGPLTAADVRLPSYFKLDAGLIFEAMRYTLRLNGRNLTGEKIYDGYFSTFQPRPQRSAEASIAVRF